MKKLVLLGLCLSTVVVAFAAGGGVSAQAGASVSATAPLKVAPGLSDQELYLQLKQAGQHIPAWLDLRINGVPQAGDGSRQGGDFASNALAIPALPYTDSGTTVGYGSEIGNAAPDVFYGLSLGSTSTITASMCATNPSWDSYLRIYTNVAGAPGTQVASSDDACGVLSEIASLVMSPGNYFIIVEGYSSYSGAYTLSVTSSGGNPCDTYAPTTVSLPTTVTGNNTGLSSVVGGAGGDAGYEFTVPAGWYSFSSCNPGTAYAADLYLYSGNPCDGGTLVTSNTYFYCEAGGSTDAAVIPAMQLQAGTYQLLVSNTGSSTGAFEVSLNMEESPCDAYVVTNLGDISGTTYNSTFSTVGSGNVYGNTSPDIGFDFTVSQAGDYFFSTCYPTTTFDSDFYLLSTNPCTGTPTEIAYVDGSCSGGGSSWNANMTWALTPGSYHLIITHYSAGLTGSGLFTIEQVGLCTPVDCTGLPTEGEAYYTGNDVTNGGCNSTPNVTSPLACGDEWCGTIFTFVSDSSGLDSRDTDWYSFTLTDSQPVTFNVSCCVDTYIDIFTYDCVDAFTSYGSDTGVGNLSVTTACLPAGTYYAFVATSGFTGVPAEENYRASFTCGAVCDLPPAITHTCLGDQENEGPWTVNATITDDNGVTGATLYYALNYGTYMTVAMTNMGGDVYEAAIPAQVNGTVVGYYIQAVDGVNTVTTSTCYFDVVDWTLAPQTLVATDANFGNVTLTWGYPAAPPAFEALVASGLSKEEALAELARVDAERVFAGYNVYRDDVLVGTVASFYTLTYIDVPPAFNTAYDYRVTALWTSGESLSSNVDSGMMLPTPTQGGPDAFGYRWMNSDDPSGQVSYSFTDISATGTAVTLSDDNSVGPFALGIPFSFYGVAQTDLYIGSNGAVSFGAGVSSLSNTILPDGFTPNNLIAAFWDDLAPHYVGSTVHYLSDVANGRFIVQYHVPAYGSIEPYTFLDFQVVLYADNSIRVNYLNLVETDVAEATTGIENADGTIGLQVNYNGSGGRLGDLLSVRFSPVQPCDVATGLVITMSAGDANLDWDAVGGASGYKVYGATDGYGPFTLLGTVVDSAFVDSGAQAAGRTFYQIVSVCD
ncbi:MAG: hypothetical protein WC326_11285 [Candidatus Delongbacteria bacterium]